MTDLGEVYQTTFPAPGTRIGKYRLLDSLGQGGVGLVFRALNEASGQVVALKTVRAASEGLLASVRREIQALGRIDHPGIVRILDGGVSEGRPFYTMELLEGATLRQHLGSVGQSQVSRTTDMTSLSTGIVGAELRIGSDDPSHAFSFSGATPRKAKAFGGQAAWFLGVIRRLCEPLAYIHGEGIVHRDLKPSNVFVRRNGTPVLMDFGLVWLQEEGGRQLLSVDAARGGTIAYMAPEQARGEQMDARGDLFALGCILYEAITGIHAFPARNRHDLIAAHEHRPLLPSQLADDVPPELDRLVMRLLERNPRDRIGHASDVAAALTDLGAESDSDLAPRAKAYLYRPELVGRGGSLDVALSHVTRLRSGCGGLVLVSGESGIGKTSFVGELARRLVSQEIRVITSGCVAVGLAGGRGLRQGGPLYPLARLLQAVADRCIAEGPNETAKLLGERAKILAATEASLRMLPGADSYAEPAEVPADAARRRLIDALAETLSAFAAERPTLLVLDDLQWADDLTLAFLESLSPRYFDATPVTIVGTYRSEESTADLERLAALAHVTALRLDHLDAAAIGAMAADMLGQRQVSHELSRFLTAESSGNPFFVAEYLRASVDAGLVFRDKRGRWQQAGGLFAPDRLGLPRNLQALITRRLETLREPARRLSEVAAVLGREVEIGVLTAVALEADAIPDESTFDEVLRDLLVRQVLEPTAAGSVRFIHDKLREVSYQGLTGERQKSLHSAAARLLERRYAERGTLERDAASLAHHFEKAENFERAVLYFDKAGEAAHGMHANHEAFRLFDKARTLEAAAHIMTPAVVRARRERLMGLDALALGNVNEALTCLTQATRTTGRPWPRTRIGLAVRSLLALGSEAWRRLVPWMGQDLALSAPNRELLLEAARAYERLLVVNYYATGDMLAVVLAATANMGLAERAGGASAERALGYATFAAMCSLLPFDKIARWYCRNALVVARESEDEIAETWVRMNVSLVHLQAGRWTEMETELEQVRTMARRMGFKRRWEEATSEFSSARFLAGRFDESALLNAELSAAIERADPQSKCWAIVRQAELALIKGDVTAAVEAARQGEVLCDQGLGFAERIYTLGALALALLRSGDENAARVTADNCAAWASRGSAPVFYNVFAYGALATVYLSLRQSARQPPDQRELDVCARRAVKRLRLAGRAMAVAAPRAYLFRALEAGLLDGRRDRALRLLHLSLDRARHLVMPYDEAMALATIGEFTDEPTEKARLLDEAADMFRRLGATFDHDRTHRLKRAETSPDRWSPQSPS